MWDWFVDMRRSFATTISPKFMLCKAKQLAELVVAEHRVHDLAVEVPDLTKHWLLRWKRDYGVVFRRPNMRYKCNKSLLLARLRCMWRNTIAVRRLAEIYLGNDLETSFLGIDEKPLHFNQTKSKGARTLELVGAPAVGLKENHTDTRRRLSIMTTVVSDLAQARIPGHMPIELLFKGKSHKTTYQLEVPDDLRMSLTQAEKGSYREENILNYVRKWFPEWTAQRALARDYRIVMMDVAKSHLGEAIEAEFWSRGFVVLLHYGCTTGVVQVNDTDLHGAFEKLYVE